MGSRSWGGVARQIANYDAYCASQVVRDECERGIFSNNQ